MTLQDIAKILNLNPVFKSASDSQKITAINQVLNDLEIESLIDETTGNKYSKQVEYYDNTTYRYLNKILGLNLKEEDVLALFQYTMNDFTNDNPLECVFEVSVVANNLSKIFTLGYSTSQSIKTITKKLLNTFSIYPTTKYYINPKQFYNEKIELGFLSKYKITDIPSIIPTFSLDYSISYDIVDLVQEDELTINYLTTYNIWE